MIGEHFPVLIPVSLLVGAVVSVPLGLWRGSLSRLVALLATGFSVVAAGVGLRHVLRAGEMRYSLGGWPPPIGIEYVADPLALFVVLVVTGVGFAVTVYSKRSLERESPQNHVPFNAVALLFLAGLSGMVMTGDLFNLYVFLEIASLAAYALVAAGEKRAPVAAFRYLVLGTVGASCYLLGVGFLYLATGSLNMADVRAILPLLPHYRLPFIALCLMVIGLGLKMALFPLHVWLPDAYTYASSVGSAYLAPVGTKVAAYALMRVWFGVFGPVAYALPIGAMLVVASVAGILVGSIMAMAQNDLKRMLAYSSVAQVGYIGLGIGLASPLGFIGAVLHILNHAVMKATLFLVSGALAYRFGTTSILPMDDRLRRAMPWTSAAFAVAALSMVGLPPTAGFFSKWYLALACLKAESWPLVAVIALSSLLNAVYFFRVLERMYLRKASAEEGIPGPPASNPGEAPPSMLIPILILGLGVLLIGLANAWIVEKVIKLAIPSGL